MNATERPRHLLLCCDGTWNAPASRTNVRQIYEFVLERCGVHAPEPAEEHCACEARLPDGSALLAFYQTGVGTEPGERIRGGVFGWGLSRKVANAYGFLVRHWRAGDRIHLVGFSRGAFIVRSLSGVVGRIGLLPADTPSEAIYEAVRASQKGRNPKRGDRFPTIRFLGVFDTVGALGIPVPDLAWLNRWLHLTRFHDTELSPVVEQACQALAIDERRGSYRPVVWSRRPGSVRLPDGSEPGIPQRVLQVWFTGSHADVGGGYADSHDLSDIALHWMLRRLEVAGLPLGPDWEKSRLAWGNPLGVRHVSTRGLFRAVEGGLGSALRAAFGSVPGIGGLAWLLDRLAVRPYERPLLGEIEADDPHRLSVPVEVQLHASVLERWKVGGMPKRIAEAVAAGMPVFREPERVDAASEVRIDHRSFAVLDRTDGGLALRGPTDLPIGARVTLEGPEIGQRRARVSWRADDRVGLAFERAA